MTVHAPRGKDRVAVLRLLRVRHAMTIADLDQHTDYRREYLASLLRQLESDGLVSYDQTTQFYRPKETDMRFRKKTTMNEPVADLREAKERLIRDFHGPHGLAIEAVADDPVLSERLAIAIADEMPSIDLSATPNHRRAAAVESAVDFWTASTAAGPCDFCGTRTARSAPSAHSYLVDPPPPSFSQKASGLKACAWCEDAMSGKTEAEFREAIFNAVAGTWGLIIQGEYRHHPTTTPFAHEVGYVGREWGHLSTGSVYEIAMRMRAMDVVHKSRFVVSANHLRIVAIPGITTPVWDAASLPNHRTVFAPLSDLRREKNERERTATSKPKGQPGHLKRMATLDANEAADAAAAEREAAELREWARQNKVL